jgi:hypothetical protein
MTRAPAAANLRTVAIPRPDAAPVTTATEPGITMKCLSKSLRDSRVGHPAVLAQRLQTVLTGPQPVS